MKFLSCFQQIIRFLFCVLLGANPVHSQQLPSGANFQAGIGKINYHNSSVYIRQSSSRAVIDWQSFNVGQGGAVHFHSAKSDCGYFESSYRRGSFSDSRSDNCTGAGLYYQ